MASERGWARLWYIGMLWFAVPTCRVYEPSLLEAPGAGGSAATQGTSASTQATSSGGSVGSPSTTSGSVSSSSTGSTTSAGGASATATATVTSTSSGAAGGATSDATTSSGGSCPDANCCPDDPDKTTPGVCGCGVPDDDTPTSTGCAVLKDGLVHRYRFTEAGAQASDSRGTSHGAVFGTTLDGSGAAALDPSDGDQYIELPPGIITGLPSLTIESWFVWSGGPVWTRLFDFGSTSVQGEPSTGETFLFFSPRSDIGPDFPYATFFFGDSSNEVFCADSEPLTTGTLHQVALALDTANQTFTLYIDGLLRCAQAFPVSLGLLDDANCWLGRSQFAEHDTFSGVFDEFRIYDVALTQRQVAFSFAEGPDPSWLEQ